MVTTARKVSFFQDTQAIFYAPPYQIWLQKVQKFRRYLLVKDGKMVTVIPAPPPPPPRISCIMANRACGRNLHILHTITSYLPNKSHTKNKQKKADLSDIKTLVNGEKQRARRMGHLALAEKGQNQKRQQDREKNTRGERKAEQSDSPEILDR